jgi:uncharacterized membrane protein
MDFNLIHDHGKLCVNKQVQTAIGILLVFAGLAIVVPILAHSTWHLYRKVEEQAASG